MNLSPAYKKLLDEAFNVNGPVIAFEPSILKYDVDILFPASSFVVDVVVVAVVAVAAVFAVSA